jgi:hypothetical protein
MESVRTNFPAASTRIVTGTGPGAEPRVQGFSGTGLPTETNFLAYGAEFKGGVFVTMGDVTDVGAGDIITGPGPGSEPRVKLFRTGAIKPWLSFLAYPRGFTGGVRTASCDVDGDGRMEIVTAPGPSYDDAGHTVPAPRVKIWKLRDGQPTVLASIESDPSHGGAWHIACGDIDGDGQSDVVLGSDRGRESEVRAYVWSGTELSEVSRFPVYDPGFTGGVRVAVSDIDADGRSEIVAAAGPGGEPVVRIFSVPDGREREIMRFYAYDRAFTGGVFVAGGARADGRGARVVTAPDHGTEAEVRVYEVSGTGAVQVTGFFPPGSDPWPGMTVGIRP